MSLVTISGEKITAASAVTAPSPASPPPTTPSPSPLVTLKSLSDSLPHIPSASSSSASPPSFIFSASVSASGPAVTASTSTSLLGAPSLSASASTSPATLSVLSSPPSLSSPPADALSLASLLSSLPRLSAEEAESAWSLSLTSLTEEIASIEHEYTLEGHAALHQRIEQIRLHFATEKSGLTPLPHADAASCAFHRVVMEAYAKLNGGKTGLNPKQVFLSRKLKAKQLRAAKKAEDAFDRQNHRLQHGRHKAKSRKKAHY